MDAGKGTISTITAAAVQPILWTQVLMLLRNRRACAVHGCKVSWPRVGYSIADSCAPGIPDQGPTRGRNMHA